ncbi:hypothetical protein [Nocardia niwae]
MAAIDVTVTVDLDILTTRELEAMDEMLAALRDLPGAVRVSGWHWD